MLKPISREELGNYQALFYNNRFMQSPYWADIKEEYGFTPYFFIYETEGLLEPIVVLNRPIFKKFSLAYIPHGPSNNLLEKVSLKSLSKELKTFLPSSTFLIRYDLLLEKESDKSVLKGCKKALADIQVPDTTILNIENDEETLLSQMHKKTRYNIRLAGKKGVIIRETDSSELDKWYDIYEITAKRDNIAIHSRAYYHSVFRRMEESSGVEIKLLLAEHEEDILAGIIVVLSGSTATYLYGASTNIKRNLMPAYLLQWEAIKLSREVGIKEYDFYGIPPFDDKSHSMSGLYRFKTGFGGDIIHRVGCWDYYLSPVSYLFSIMERLRQFYYKKLRKRG